MFSLFTNYLASISENVSETIGGSGTIISFNAYFGGAGFDVTIIGLPIKIANAIDRTIILKIQNVSDSAPSAMGIAINSAKLTILIPSTLMSEIIGASGSKCFEVHGYSIHFTKMDTDGNLYSSTWNEEVMDDFTVMNDGDLKINRDYPENFADIPRCHIKVLADNKLQIRPFDIEDDFVMV